MKRRDLIRKIEEGGAVLIRHGARHDWYQKPQTKMSQPIPRHTEIKEHLAKGKMGEPRVEINAGCAPRDRERCSQSCVRRGVPHAWAS